MANRQAKGEIRAEMCKFLSSLDSRWLNAASKELCGIASELLNTISLPQSARFLAWVKSFVGEPDLSLLIAEQVLRRRTFLPRMTNDDQMIFIEVKEDWGSNLIRSSSKVLQPANGEDLDLDSDDPLIVLVPGLAFDRQGQRIGRGKGHYDRFLNSIREKAFTTIGICWSFQIIPDVPKEKHDIPIDIIVTEEEWFRCRS